MYESGLSKTARTLFLIMAVLLGIAFIMTSGCACHCANASDFASATVIETQAGHQHSFF